MYWNGWNYPYYGNYYGGYGYPGNFGYGYPGSFGYGANWLALAAFFALI